MKILHVIPSLSAVHGGPSRAIRLIAQALLAQGVAVDIATTDDDGPGKRAAIAVGTLFQHDSTQRVPIVTASEAGQSSLGILDRHGLLPRDDGLMFWVFPKRTEFYKVSPGFARWVLKHVRDYDLIHIHALFSFTSIAAAWAARWAGVPYVVRPLGTLAQYGISQRRPWLKRLSLRFVEGPILRHAAAVHFTAEAEKREAEALGIPMRGVVIPLGVEATSPSGTPEGHVIARSHATKQSSSDALGGCLDRHDLRPRDDGVVDDIAAGLFAQYPQLANKRIVLFLSRLDAKKNLEGLMKAFSLLLGKIAPSPLRGRDGEFTGHVPRPSSGSAVQAGTRSAREGWGEGEAPMLLIAGDGEPAYVASLKKLADELGLINRLVWAGHLDGELKAAALAAAHVFVLPSYSENFGIAAAEALMAGLPCVLGEGVAIADEVAQAGAGVVTSTNAEDIAHGLREVLSDETRRAEMGKRAAMLARDHYSLETMGGNLKALYSKILLQKLSGQIE